MPYDPFARGPHPVGVTSASWTDAERARTLKVEIWYPGDDAHRGQDLDETTWDTFLPDWAAALDPGQAQPVAQQAVRDAAWGPGGPFPLILLIHGWAGFRREATFIGTHLASHGYVVVSPDVTGSTWGDVDAFLSAQSPTGDPQALLAHSRDIAANRVRDIPFLIESAIAALPVRPEGIGVTGASFGGFSSMVAPTADARVRAIAAMCPANDDAPILAPERVLGDYLQAPWLSDAATLILVADRDSLLPLYGQLRLLRMIPATDKRLVCLARADHNHFVDDIDVGHAWMAEFVQQVAAIFPDGPGDWPRVARSIAPIDQLVPGDQAKLAWRGVVTAHFDANLRDDPAAVELLRDIDAMLDSIGVESSTVTPGHP
ncbi:MAG: dienelactone hydrolase family protein [Actinomycetales bacterium]|nr:dienelactone hydrolase family protein [Actinomycetales bacterium]